MIDTWRMTGRSTRLIDEYIQTLFNEGSVKVRDHHFTRHSDKFLFDRVVRRLKNEHRHDSFEYNTNHQTIKLKVTHKKQDDDR